MKSKLSKLSSLLAAVSIFACQPQKPSQSETKIVDHVHDARELTNSGSFGVIEIGYSTAAAADKDLFPNTNTLSIPKTDVRGQLYLPDDSQLPDEKKGHFPVIVFLHGNHGTCGVPAADPKDPRSDDSVQYTSTGTCASNEIESPSHLGYAYSARQLASWGYAVISVNANRGITGGSGVAADGGLVYARGALVLKHLMKLRNWSNSLKVANDKIFKDSVELKDPKAWDLFKNKFDFTEVGVMGHSRGGEGVRYAYNIYQNAAANTVWKKELPDLKIKGVFEIAPVDFGAGNARMKIEARGTAWALLLGGCDRDVSSFMGTGPYARMLQTNDGFPKAIFAAWGANHNFFNSEWQVSDAPHSCYGNQVPLWDWENAPLSDDSLALKGVKGSTKQQNIAKSLMFAFFRANVGKQVDPSLMDTFDPQYALPKTLDAQAPNSREFVRLQDSQLVANPGQTTIVPDPQGIIRLETVSDKVAKDKAALEAYWKQYGTEQNKRIQLDFDVPETFARKSLLLESDKLAGEHTYTVPFQNTVDSTGFWTIDASFARRTTCPEDDCAPDTSISDIDVAVVYEDGTSSNFVHLDEYIKLENFHNTYFSMDGVQEISGGYSLYYSFVPLVYSTARFELTDFALQNARIKGLRLKFPAGKAVALAIDEIRLVKRPGIAH